MTWPLSDEDIEQVTKAAVEYLLAGSDEDAARLLLNSRLRLRKWWWPEDDPDAQPRLTISLLLPGAVMRKAEAGLEATGTADKLRRAIREAMYGLENEAFGDAYTYLDVALTTDSADNGWRQEMARALAGEGMPTNQARASAGGALLVVAGLAGLAKARSRR